MAYQEYPHIPKPAASPADRMIIVFHFNDGDGDAGFVGKNVIRFFGFATGRGLSANDHAAFGEINLLTNLIHHVPFIARNQGRGHPDFGKFTQCDLLLH
jgi:hypothetical protein